MQVLTTTLFPHRYARGPQRSARGDLAGIPRPVPCKPVLDHARVGAHDRRGCAHRHLCHALCRRGRFTQAGASRRALMTY